jgi:hypothetical protein
MKRSEFRKSVRQTAIAIRKKHGLMVKINHMIPTVAVMYRDKSSAFFAQGEDAEHLLAGCPDDINVKDWIVFTLDSAGVEF